MRGHVQNFPQVEPESRPQATKRLNSWKEIASFFEKDVRTMHRWEAERGLPVHRVPGPGRGRVFAYTDELERWLNENPTPAGSSVAEVPAAEVVPSEAIIAAEVRPETVSDAVEEIPAAGVVEPMPSVARPGWMHFAPPRAILALGLTAVFLVVTLSVWSLRANRPGTLRPAAPVVAQPVSTGVRQSANPAAQEVYLRGLYFRNLRTEASLQQAIDLFTQSIVLDPKFALSYAGLADSYLLLRQYGHMPDSEAFPRALSASRQALALDDSSPEAHRTYGFLLNYWLWNFPAAEHEFQRAIALDPNNAETHHWYATSLFSVGKYREALKEIDIARQLQPDSISILADRGLLLGSVDPEAAYRYLGEVAQANPDFASVHMYLAEIYLNNGKYREFLAERSRVSALKKDKAGIAVEESARAELARHGSQAMFRVLGEGFGTLVDQGYPNAMAPSDFFSRAGDADGALRYLTLACTRHEAYFLDVDRDPEYRPLYSNPRFQALLGVRRTPLAPGDSIPSCPAARG